MSVAWSEDEQDILTFTNLETGSVEVQYHHLDEFDADEDFSVTVGEFSPEALRFALLGPAPATTHVANKRLNPVLRHLRRWAKGKS